MTKTIAQIVTTSLDDAGQDYLEDIVAHGIHNITNSYNGDSDEEYAAYSDEFNRQARVLLNIPASPM